MLLSVPEPVDFHEKNSTLAPPVRTGPA